MSSSVWSVLGSAKTMAMPPATCLRSGPVMPEPQPSAS